MAKSKSQAGANDAGGNETGADASQQPGQQAQAAAAVTETGNVAQQLLREATPVVKVTATRDRWRAKRFWPKGDTELTLAEAEALGQAGFEQLRGDAVFTIVPLAEADKQGESA